MKKLFLYSIGIIIVLIGAFFLLNAYIYHEKQGEPTTQTEDTIIAENPEGEADPSRMTLGMQTWKWVDVLYGDEHKITPIKTNVFTITFKNNGEFIATTDCNAVSGTYTTNGNQIAFTNIVATEKACGNSQEKVFTELIRDTTSYHFTNRGQLIFDLKFDSGNATFR